MKENKINAGGERSADQARAEMGTTTLLDVQEVASLLNCSTRHVYRLADAGRMPHALKLGALVRWNRATLEEWIDNGCQPMRKGVGQ